MKRSFWKWLAVAGGVLLAICCALYFFIRPLAEPVLNKTLSQVAEQKINGSCTWDSVHLSPGFDVVIEGASLKDSKGRGVLKSPEIEVDWSMASLIRSLYRGEGAVPAITRVVIDTPAVDATRNTDNTWNLASILKENKNEQKTLFYGRILFKNGNINLHFNNNILSFKDTAGQVYADDGLTYHGSLTSLMEKSPLRLEFTYKDTSDFSAVFSGDHIPVTIANSGLVSLPESLKNINIEGGELSVHNGKIGKNGGALSLHIPGTISGGVITYDSYHVTDITAGFDVYNGNVHIKDISGRINGELVTGKGDIDYSGDTLFTGDIHTRLFDLSKLPLSMDVKGLLTSDLHVSGSLSNPSLSGNIYGRNLSVNGMQADKLYAAFTYADKKINISSFDAAIGGGSLKGYGSYDMDSGNIVLSATADSVNLADILSSYGVSGRVSGTVDANAAYDGNSFTLANASGSMTGTNLSYNNMSAGSLTASFAVHNGDGSVSFDASNARGMGVSLDSAAGIIYKNGDTYEISTLSGKMGDGVFHADGTAGGNTFNLNVNASNIDLSSLSSLSGIEMTGRASFNGTVAGNMNNPVINGTIHGENGAIHGISYKTIDGNISSDGNTTTLHNVTWTTEDGSHIISGTLGFSKDSPVNLTVTSKKARIEELLRAAGLAYPVTGWINNELHVIGTLGNPIISGHAQAWNGSVKGNLYQNAVCDYEYKDGIVSLSNAILNAYEGIAEAKGTISQDKINLDVSLVDMETERILPGKNVSGKATLRGHVDGTLTSPHFTGYGEAREIYVGDASLYQLSANVEYENGTVALSDGFIYQGGGSFKWSGSTSVETGALNGTLTFSGWNMGEAAKFVKMPLKNITGTIDGSMTIHGTMDNPDMVAKFTVGSGKLGEEPISGGKVDVSYLNGALTINEFRIPVGNGVLAAKGSMSKTQGFNLEAAAMNMDISWISEVLGRDDMHLGGNMTASVKLTGSVDKPNAEISVGVTNPSYNDYTFDEAFIMGNITEGVVNIQQGFGRKGEYKASMHGTMPVEMITRKDTGSEAAPVNLDFNLDNADLNAIALFAKPVTSASGPIHGHVKMYGSWKDPELSGNVNIENGIITLTTMSDPITNVNGSLEFKGKEADLNLSSSIGGGSASATGTAAWNNSALTHYNGEFHLHAPSIRSTYYTGAADADLTFEEIMDNPGVKGTVSVHDATVDIPMSFEEGGNSLPLFMDVDVNIGDKSRLYNRFFYDLAVHGNIHAMGLLSAPVMSGKVAVDEGTVKYLSNEFKVSDGYAVWGGVPDSFLPVVHLTGLTKVGHYDVTMKLDGPPGAFQFNLSSEPALNDQQIVTLLTVHQDPNGDGGDAAAGALFNAGLQMVFSSNLQNYLKDTIGLDYISVTSSLTDYYDSATSQNDNYYYIKIGKYLFNDFMLTATTGLNNNDTSFGFHYDVNKGLGLSAWVTSDHDKYIGADWKFNF